MSAIAGILHFDPVPARAEELERMLNTLRARSPGAVVRYFSGSIGFGQILQETGSGTRSESLRLIHPSGRWALAFDGRIDNRGDLKRDLQLEGQDSGNAGDEQLVLAAYARWGQRCAEHLLGDFAFAIWDDQEHTLFGARDQFGVKPFYYALDEGGFAFASHPAALLTWCRGGGRLNEARIADFLLDLEGEDLTSTFYEGIFRLAHGHLIVVQPGKLHTRRYWELHPSQQERYSASEEAVEAFRELLAEAVRCRMAHSAETGLGLSGGLDSAAIFGTARWRLSPPEQTLHTFSLIEPHDQRNQESRYIQMLLDESGVSADRISLQEAVLGQVGELAITAEPFDWHMNIWKALYTRVRAQGIRACLDGLDGDLLLANTSLAQWLWRRGQWRAALGETLLAQGQAAYFNRPGFLLYRSLRVAMVPEWLRQVRRSLWRGKRLAKALQVSIINPEFARRVGVEERLERFDAYDPPSNPASQTEAHRISFNHPHLQAALERYDRVASIYAIEPRHPLLDVRLAEFCLDLPWQLKTQRGWTKRVMRQAMQPYLPGEVVWRRDKDHLGWLLNVEILKARPGDYRQVLDEGRGDLRAYVDMGKIERAWGEFFSTGKDEPARWLWEAIALAQWLRHQKETLGMLRTLPKGLLE